MLDDWRTRFCIGALALALSALSATAARAASLWAPRGGGGGFAVEFLRPSIETIDADALVGAAFVSAWTSPRRGVAFEFEVPVARQNARPRHPLYSYTYIPSPDPYSSFYTNDLTGSTIGNPYLGLRTVPESSPLSVELGLRLPVAQEDERVAITTAMYADASRWEAFRDHRLSVRAALNVREVASTHLFHQFRIGPVVSFYTNPGRSPGPDLDALYSWQIGYDGRTLRLGTGIAGRVLLSRGSLNIGELNHDQFEVHADFLKGSVRPGLDLHLPLGAWAESSPLVLGSSVTFVP